MKMSFLLNPTITKKCWCMLRTLSPSIKISSRSLLSAQYSCDEEWDKRLVEDDTLKHISTERYFFELNQKYQQKQPISAVDVDIFINALHRPESIMELEHIIKRFRSTPKTVDTLESTHHAVCRFYLTNKKLDELIHILNNRVEFGVFPDPFMYNILLDQFIKTQKWDQALEIVKLLMLQEDSGNEITKTLALYALNQRLVDSKFAPIETKVNEDENQSQEDDEIEYIRVPYLTNPYFDDHFDLVNRDHIFGKSMYFFARELEKSSTNDHDLILAHSTMIIGLIFFQKWQQLNELIDRLSSGKNVKPKLAGEVFQTIEKHVEFFQTEPDCEHLTKIKSRLENEFQREVPDLNLSDLIGKRIENLAELELNDRKEICDMFDTFKKNRMRVLNEQLERALQDKRQKEISKQQKEYEDKKRLYYFFENFPKHEIDFVEAEERIKEIRSKTVVEENYVPPEKY